MFTTADVNNFFSSLTGFQIPEWVWLIAGVIFIIVVFIMAAGSRPTKWKKGDLRISRDRDGSYYAYEVKTGDVVFFSEDRQEVAKWVSQHVE